MNPIPTIQVDGHRQLDSVDLSECMLRRMPMLKSCLRFFRGRFRQCWRLALQERCRAKQAGDVECLVPMIFLCKPRSAGSVGRDKLAKRFGSGTKKATGQIKRERDKISNRSLGQKKRNWDKKTSIRDKIKNDKRDKKNKITGQKKTTWDKIKNRTRDKKKQQVPFTTLNPKTLKTLTLNP